MTSKQLVTIAGAILLVAAWIKFAERPTGENLVRAVARSLGV
jgi:hypothetical protein